MYQSGITERNGKFGLWVNGYGYIWFKTLIEAQTTLSRHPIV